MYQLCGTNVLRVVCNRYFTTWKSLKNRKKGTKRNRQKVIKSLVKWTREMKQSKTQIEKRRQKFTIYPFLNSFLLAYYCRLNLFFLCRLLTFIRERICLLSGTIPVSFVCLWLHKHNGGPLSSHVLLSAIISIFVNLSPYLKLKRNKKLGIINCIHPKSRIASVYDRCQKEFSMDVYAHLFLFIIK